MTGDMKNILAASEIAEDAVQVHIFSTTNLDMESWKGLSEQINSTVKTLSRDYIWHRDEFSLSLPIVNADTEDIPMHLSSTVCFGDNIEDEWFIVYLVMEISKSYEDLIIQILDSDGDFLLIEAALHLPSWANPESTENRVFIFKNAVHVIPPHLLDMKSTVKIKDSLTMISNIPEQTKVTMEIQEAIQARVGQYPEKMKENFHRAIVNLPLDIAALLTLQPSLIAPIVTTYCNHDMIDAKSCSNLLYTDCKPVQVKFTKCLYAMLLHSQHVQNLTQKKSKSSDKKDILGIKLTCGYQMIMNTKTRDVFCTKEYMKFEKSLKNNNYFRGNIEGSCEYKQLLEKARQYFLDKECPINLQLSNRIAELKSTNDYLHTKKILMCQNISEQNLIEDNDNWLNINPNQLDDLLNKRYGKPLKSKNKDVTPETITATLTDFLKQSSDFEGVDTKRSDNNDNEGINFDADEFVNCLEKMMNFLSSDLNELNLEDDDSDNEYESDNSDNAETELDKELAEKLNSFKESENNSKAVVFNLAQSIKEEGISGPSSNLLTMIGIDRNDILDSDDD